MMNRFKNLKYGIPVLLIILLIVVMKVQNRVSCINTPAILNIPNVVDSTVNLLWKNGQNNKMAYLNVSTSKSLKPDGSFKENANIVNDVVTDRNSYLKSNLEVGTYYWNVISDGCGQRKVSTLGTFTIQSASNNDTACELAPAILGIPDIEGFNVTFSWISDQQTKATYINTSTSNDVNAEGILKDINTINDSVSNGTSFTKENMHSGTYYWNVISDGCGQRKVSTLGTFTIQSTSE